MDLGNIFHLGIKELRGLLHNTVMMILVIYSFTLSIYSSGTATMDTLNDAAISIVDEDQSTLSNRITSAFYPPYFVLPQEITISEMDSRMDAGLDTFALNIPPDFQRDLLAGKSPVIQLNVDATRSSQATTGTGYVQEIVSSEINEYAAGYRMRDDLEVDLTLRSRYNPELETSWFGSITDVISAITMLSIILTGAALIREKEHGTVEHLLVMPVSTPEIMISKIWSMGLVVLVATIFSMIFVVQWLLDVSITGSVPLFLCGVVLMLFATTSLGIFLATLAGSMPQFGLLLIMVLFPLQSLSGGMTPMESMPLVIQRIMIVAPTSHFTTFSQAVLFRAAGVDVVWPQMLALLAIGSGMFCLALWRFRTFLR
jgi:ABC-2 type transport system permease protein